MSKSGSPFRPNQYHNVYTNICLSCNIGSFQPFPIYFKTSASRCNKCGIKILALPMQLSQPATACGTGC